MIGVLSLLAAVVLFVTAGVQAADALGVLSVKSYPFISSDRRGLKWAYVAWLLLGSVVAVTVGVLAT